MSDQTIQTVVRPQPLPGPGILRPFPSAELKQIDPFVFLDTAAPQQLGQASIYVARHAHRGVQPVSLLFRGRVSHRDSLGIEAEVSSGGMQWLISGSGALHEETLRADGEGVFHMAQLWVNLPAEEKMHPPQHHAVLAAEIPELDSLGAGSKLRLYAGKLMGQVGPAPMPTPVVLAHLKFEAEGTISIPLPEDFNVGLTIVDGLVELSDGLSLSAGGTAVYHQDGQSVSLSSSLGGQALLMAGLPLNEPMATGAGFVMNTEEEIRQAFGDLEAGGMGHLEGRR